MKFVEGFISEVCSHQVMTPACYAYVRWQGGRDVAGVQPLYHYAAYGLVTILAIVVAILVLKILGWTAERLRLRFRNWTLRRQGVHFESMRPGSTFVKAEIPPIQISLHRPGLVFGSAHQGFGIRFQKYLVTPAHVLQDAKGEGNEVILVGPLGRVMVQVDHAVPSRNVSDLVYLYFPESIWVKLGIKSCLFSKNISAPAASVTGYEGTSLGRVTETSMYGMVAIDASTLNGMSGAPYIFGGKVLALHIGATGLHNVGVTANIIAFELAKLISGESSHPLSASYAQDVKMTSGKTWSSHIDENMEDAWRVGNSWVDEEDVDDSFYLKQLGYESMGQPKPSNRTVLMTEIHDPAVKKVLEKQQLLLSGQNQDGTDLLLKVHQATSTGTFLERINALTDLVKDLDARVKSLEGKPTSSDHYPCLDCGKTFKLEVALNQHAQMKHQKVALSTLNSRNVEISNESASATPIKVYPEPKSVIKVTKDFRLRPASKKKKSLSSRRVSKSSAPDTRSPVQEECLRKMIELQQKTERSLEVIARSMAGPNLATMRS